MPHVKGGVYELRRWYEHHAVCVTEMVSAGGIIWLVCLDCHVSQTQDSVDAGNPLCHEGCGGHPSSPFRSPAEPMVVAA